MSTYSPDLRIELITTGDQAGTWGATTNTNLSYVIEQAIAGYISVAVIAADQALTHINGGSATAALNQSVHANIALTTSTGADFAVYAPPASKQYTIYNASNYVATIYNSTVIGNTTAAGAGVVVPAGKTVTVWSDGTNFAFQNNHLISLTLGTDLAVADGGTGASDAAGARASLGLGTMATQAANNVAITGGSITGITDLAVVDGGTGASTAADARTNLGVTATGQDTTYAYRANNLSDLASAVTARTNLGLGTMATQAASSVSITGGTITGITDLAVADGGTGASDVAGARANLGVTATGQDTTYAYRANNLSDLASAATARTNLGLGTMATQAASNVAITGGTIAGITDLAVVDGGTGASTAADARTNLGLGTMSTQAASSVAITGGTIAGVAITGGSITGITDLAVADGGTGASTAADARTNLGLGTMATQDASSVAITGGTITGITDLAIADGGTGASTAAAARANLNLGTMATQAASAVMITGGFITGITDLAVADGGTGASSFTSGALLKGAGASAIAVASSADIVGQIGATAVTNATTVTTTVASAATGTTQTYGTSNTQLATTAFVQAALQALHPVGSIYINAGVTTNPATLLGFGTWAAFGAGRVLVGLNGADPLFDALEETGGSKDAVVVSHTHTATVTDPGHFHTTTLENTTGAGGNPGAKWSALTSVTATNSANTDTKTTGISVANSTTGSSGTDANLQPYITVAMWKRTA